MWSNNPSPNQGPPLDPWKFKLTHKPTTIFRSVAIQTDPQPIDIFRSVEIQTEPQPSDQQIIEPRRSLRSRKPPPKQVQAKNQPKTVSKGDNCPAIIDMINKNARQEGREISDTTAKTQVKPCVHAL